MTTTSKWPLLLACCAALLLLSPAASADTADLASFEPSALILGVTALFGFATLSTGLAALFLNKGLSMLVKTGSFVPAGAGTPVQAPNVRGWGARQVATGVTLWAALLLGDQVLFQVGLASVVIRQVLDVTANVMDGTYSQIPPFFVLGVPAVAALVATM